MRKAVLTLCAALAACSLCGLGAASAAAGGGEAQSGYAYSYDFTAMTMDEIKADFAAGFDPEGNDAAVFPDAAESAGWITYGADVDYLFDVGENGLTTKQSILDAAGDGVENNDFYLRYDTKQFQYFKMEATYKAADARDGWAGLFFGLTNTARKPDWPDSPKGAIFVTKKDGKVVYRGNAISANGYLPEPPEDVANWNSEAAHTIALNVYRGHVSYSVDGVEVLSLTPGDDDVGMGYIGLFCTNRVTSFTSFSFTPQAADGSAYEAVESFTLTDPPTTATAFTPVTLEPVFTPAGATNQSLRYSSPNAAFTADGNKLIFLEAGTFAMTATSADNAEAEQTFTVTVAEPPLSAGEIAYPFSADDMKHLSSYFVQTSGSGVETPYGDHWTLNEQALTLTRKSESGGVDSAQAFLYLKDRRNGKDVTAANFQISFYAKASSKDGWYGIVFDRDRKLETNNQRGESLFVGNGARNMIAWGNGNKFGSGAQETFMPLYKYDVYNLFRFRFYGKGTTTHAEVYVNDMSEPLYQKDIAALGEGLVGIFASSADVTFRNLTYAPLDGEGGIVTTVAAESVAIRNKLTSATVGDDAVTLSVAVGPDNATDKSVTYSSSDPTVCQISREGVMTFLSPGTATITVSSNSDPSVSDSFTITVSAKETPVDPTPSPSASAEPSVPPEKGGKGCGCGSVGFFGGGGPGTWLFLGAIALCAFVLVRLTLRSGRRCGKR